MFQFFTFIFTFILKSSCIRTYLLIRNLHLCYQLLVEVIFFVEYEPVYKININYICK